jgi:hypothetical protein
MLEAVADIAHVEEALDVHIEAEVAIEDIATDPAGNRCLQSGRGPVEREDHPLCKFE